MKYIYIVSAAYRENDGSFDYMVIETFFTMEKAMKLMKRISDKEIYEEYNFYEPRLTPLHVQ